MYLQCVVPNESFNNLRSDGSYRQYRMTLLKTAYQSLGDTLTFLEKVFPTTDKTIAHDMNSTKSVSFLYYFILI
jgi:hypothetical protein